MTMDRVTLRVPPGLVDQVEALYVETGYYPNRSEAIRSILSHAVREERRSRARRSD